MHRVVKDAWYDRVIDDMETTYFLDWAVYNNTGNSIKDSLYKAVADGLNRELDINENETTNPYTEEVTSNVRRFTAKSLKRLVTENYDSYSSLDITNIETDLFILQKTLKIKFVIFEMFQRESDVLDIGDMVLYDDRPTRIIGINETNGRKTYNLYNGYIDIPNVTDDEFILFKDNILDTFRVQCQYDMVQNEEYNINECMFLVVVENENKEKRIRVVQQTNKSLIFPISEIPNYIQYFIFNNCSKIILDPNKLKGMDLTDIESALINFQITRNKRIEQSNIEEDIEKIRDDINKYETELTYFKNTKDKRLTLEQRAEKFLLEEEIKDLKQRQRYLKSILKSNKQTNNRNMSSISGGDVSLEKRQRPSEQYTSYNNLNPQIPQNQTINSNLPSNIIYLPHQLYPYPQQYKYLRTPYNVSQNKEKDQKSKLSFYITIELELFPGTTASVLQKSIVKCQTTFERVREAWSNIFGFQYRPAPMNEAYVYNSQTTSDQKSEEKKSKTEKNRKIEKEETEKNKTRKYRK
jgi:hypothetical protein